MKFIQFVVLGVPAPKGSHRAMATKTGKAVNVPSGSSANKTALADWGSAVRQAAVNAVHAAAAASYCDAHGDGGINVVPAVFFPAVALRLKVEFRMPRLKGHFNPKTGQLRPSAPKWHLVAPDKDKLLRSTKDCLKGIVILDDKLIAETFARKVYGNPGQEGAWIRIEELP